jgi:hypothetical protein
LVRELSCQGADQHNFILNETAVRELNIRQPVIGQRWRMHGQTGHIIDVAKDFRYKSLHEKTGALVIFSDPAWWNFFLVRTAPGKAAAAVSTIETTWKRLMPGLLLSFLFLR